MSGRRENSGRGARLLAGAVIALATGAAVAAAGAADAPPGAAPRDSVATTPTAAADSAAAAADTTDALSGYLGTLSLRTDDEFLLQQLSISDAEVDSLIRAAEAQGAPAARVPFAPRWDAGVAFGAFRFNRVEGVNVMGDGHLAFPTARPLRLFARAGWGWASGEPTWRGGTRLDGVPLLPARSRLEIAHTREVWAYGSGGVPGNSLIALAAGRDQDDYYLGEGPSVSLDVPAGPVRAGAAWILENQSSLPNATDFTVFDEGSHFRPNPPIDDGRVSRVELSLGAGDVVRGRWAADAVGTLGGHGLGGDFDFDRVTLELRLRQPLWFGDVVRATLDGANVGGDAPRPSLYFLGGTKRLRGYPVNEFPLTRGAHVAVDYSVGTNPLGWVPWVRRLRIQPVPFLDGAVLLESRTATGGRIEHHPALWRFDAGVGLEYNLFGIPGGSGRLRLDVARRLDRDDDNMTYRLGFTLER